MIDPIYTTKNTRIKNKFLIKEQQIINLNKQNLKNMIEKIIAKKMIKMITQNKKKILNIINITKKMNFIKEEIKIDFTKHIIYNIKTKILLTMKSNKKNKRINKKKINKIQLKSKKKNKKVKKKLSQDFSAMMNPMKKVIHQIQIKKKRMK